MATLAFCTAYASHSQVWESRYRRWVEAMQSNSLNFDLLMLIDDGSASLPDWPEADVLVSLDERPRHRTAIYHFHRRLGRPALFAYPGWFRSFCLAARYAEKHGFEKVVHIESDAFLISSRAVQWANSVTDGWEAPWSEHHRFPETAIQVMAGSGLRAYFEFCQIPYSRIVGLEAEVCVPFTAINRDLRGDRLRPPNADIPRDYDWVAQTTPSADRSYYWWLPEEACTEV